LDEKKFALPRQCASGFVLRADATKCRLDDVEKFGDHFTKNLTAPVGHPLGDRKFFFKKFSPRLCSKEEPP